MCIQEHRLCYMPRDVWNFHRRRPSRSCHPAMWSVLTFLADAWAILTLISGHDICSSCSTQWTRPTCPMCRRTNFLPSAKNLQVEYIPLEPRSLATFTTVTNTVKTSSENLSSSDSLSPDVLNSIGSYKDLVASEGDIGPKVSPFSSQPVRIMSPTYILLSSRPYYLTLEMHYPIWFRSLMKQ